jgi:prepilin-type N-terminal cleavage/methylation domain-containing protein
VWVNSCGASTGRSSTEPTPLANSLSVPMLAFPDSSRSARSRRSSRSLGFTLIEIMLALIVLSVGILALSGSSAMVNRMIGRGRIETHAALLAARRVEKLRMAAASTSPRCTSASFISGGPVWEDGLRQSWSVGPAGPVRKVRVSVSYLTIRGTRSAVLETGIPC